MAELTVAAGAVRALMDLAVSKGANRRTLAERSGVDPLALQDQDARLPFARYVALMRAGQVLCRDPALALHFGESVGPADISVGCLVGAFSETVGEGFALMNRYARLSVEVEGVGTGDRFVLVRRPGQAWIVDTRQNPNHFPELTESTFARIACAARRSLGDRQFVRAVHVTHAEPAYRAEYDRVFGVPVVFGSDKNALLIADAWMAQRPQSASRPVLRILRAHAETLLGRLEGSTSMRGRVEAMLRPLLHTGEAGAGVIAGKLGLSRQTLYRKLKAEGVTYEKVLDELRHRMALHYLGSQKASVHRTAYLLGFSEPSAFSRAFKRWTGSSPRRHTPHAACSA